MFIAILIFTSATSFASPIEKCLASASETTKTCAEKYIKNLNMNNCFKECEKLKSDLSKENLKQFCFFEVSEFSEVNTCLSAANKFTVAINHDEAVFECVRQFQSELNPTKCLLISKKMRYPEKAQHLSQHCQEL